MPETRQQRLVSCLLATRNRPLFVRQALRCFMRQTHTNRELIVVDDGDLSVEHLCAGVTGIKYIRLTQPAYTGTKLNIAVEQAKGDVLQKIDDDDFYGREFLAHAEARLPRRRTHCTIVAWCCFLVLFRGDPRLRHSGHGWTSCGTLCFHRDLWRLRPFRDIPYRADAWFLYDHRPRVLRVCAAEQYLVVRHGANTWRKMEGGAVDDYLRARPLFHKPLDEIVQADDIGFYHGLTNWPE